MVPAIAESRRQLEEILYQSAVTVDEWIFRRPMHICAVLDIFVWDGARLLKLKLFIQHNHSVQYNNN